MGGAAEIGTFWCGTSPLPAHAAAPTIRRSPHDTAPNLVAVAAAPGDDYGYFAIPPSPACPLRSVLPINQLSLRSIDFHPPNLRRSDRDRHRDRDQRDVIMMARSIY